MSCSKSLQKDSSYLSRTASLTKQAFKQAEIIVNFKLRNANDKEYRELFQEMVDKEYLKQVCNLSTEDLDVIIYEHHSGYVKREPKTIEVILDELSERILLGKA
jgi:hypothetical protein